MKICKQGGCTREDVAEFERSYNVQFPPDYQEFLVKYNGGITPNSYCQISRKIVSVVTVFYGIGDVRFSVQKEEFGEGTEFPKILKRGLFPVGEDIFGNIFLLRIHNKPGEVYFYTPEFCPFEENPTYLIADSFTAFLQKCWSGEFRMDRALRSIKEREQLMFAMGKKENISDELKKNWQDEIDIFTGAAEEEIALGTGKVKSGLLRRIVPPKASEIDTEAIVALSEGDYKFWRQFLDNSALAVRFEGYEGHFDLNSGKMQLIQKKIHRMFTHNPIAEVK